MKRLALLVLVCAGCKADPKPAAPPAADTPTPTERVHHGRVAPALPPSEQEGSDRPALQEDRPWRHRGEHRMDTDGDGVVSPEEREAARHARVESMRTRFDTNGDGKLTPDELENAQGRMHFDNAAALDTNHDGDISADELEAGMQARRDAWRAQRAAAQGSGTAQPAPTTAPAPTP